VTSTTERQSPVVHSTLSALPQAGAAQSGRSIFGTIGAYFLIRIAARASYGILSAFLAQRVTGSATVAAVIVTIFFISELGLAPIFGNLSDRRGRKPYLVLSPLAGAAAAVVFVLITLLPGTNLRHHGWERIGLVAVFAAGRLLEGISAAASTPAGLGFLADVTASNEAWRVRVMTAFEVTTVLGVVVGIPVGSILYGTVGVHGFFGVLVLYLIACALLLVFMVESRVPGQTAAPVDAAGHKEGLSREAVRVYRTLLQNARLLAFVPAWLAINALLAAFLGLTQFMLSLPTRAAGNLAPGQQDADLRFPHQLLVGGYRQADIARVMGIFGAVLIIGMILWTFILPRLGRARTMRVALIGFVIIALTLTFINRLAENPQSLTARDSALLYVLMPLVGVGILIASGFAPAALTHLATLSEEDPEQRGAIMGLYSLLLGGGQLLGTWIGGIFVDLAGFNGLAFFSTILIVLAVWSVQASQGHINERAPVPVRATATEG